MDRRELLDDPEEALRLALEQQQAKLWTALPGYVVSANLAAQTVVVQPTVQGVIINEQNEAQLVALPLLVDVPICWPRTQGFAMTFPISAGDEVLVVFASRCIDAWWQNGGIGAPAEPRMHDLSDGFAILAPTSQPNVLANVQTDGLELRDAARDTYIKLGNGTITIKGNITLMGDMTQTGALNVTGNVTTTGTIENNGKHVDSTHTHGGIQPGASNTAVPN